MEYSSNPSLLRFMSSRGEGLRTEMRKKWMSKDGVFFFSDPLSLTSEKIIPLVDVGRERKRGLFASFGIVCACVYVCV